MPSFQPQMKMDQQRAANWIHALRFMDFVTARVSTSLFGRVGTMSSRAITVMPSEASTDTGCFLWTAFAEDVEAGSWGRAVSGKSMMW